MPALRRTRALVAAVGLGCVLVLALSTTAVAQQAKPKIESLTWLAGTRYIDRPDGSRSYETLTGPTAGIVTGSVDSPNNGGLSEFFRIGPNEKGEYEFVFQAQLIAGVGPGPRGPELRTVESRLRIGLL